MKTKPVATKIYSVTVIVADFKYRETFTVEAQDEWKARTIVHRQTTLPLSGQFVDYEVSEL